MGDNEEDEAIGCELVDDDDDDDVCNSSSSRKWRSDNDDDDILLCFVGNMRAEEREGRDKLTN